MSTYFGDISEDEVRKADRETLITLSLGLMRAVEVLADAQDDISERIEKSLRDVSEAL